MKKHTLAVFLYLLVTTVFSQDIEYARSIVQKLASEEYHGRGYVKRGDWKAAKYIGAKFYENELNRFDNSHLQDYSFPMNTFPGKLLVSVDENELEPGVDYVISASSPGINKTLKVVDLRSLGSNTDSILLAQKDKSQEIIYLVNEKNSRNVYGRSYPNISAIAVVTEKTPYWHVSNGKTVEETVWLKIREDKIPDGSNEIKLRFKNKFFEHYQTQNVYGWVKGTKYPDKYFVVTAHYDHLGMMGNSTYYPGANDNASGTAMIMDLARHYSLAENRPEYSILFIAFSGEEAGLYGSFYFTIKPTIPLENIELVINLDMVGSGSEGITVVNGTLYDDLMNQMNEINKEENLLVNIKPRTESCNSDHCPFYQNGVKSIFIYTRGKELQEYHTITDQYIDFPFTAYNGLFGLLTGIIENKKKQ